MVVITQHNTKSYQIDSLTFDITPKTCVFEWKTKNGEKVKDTMVSYYRDKYNIDLRRMDEN